MNRVKINTLLDFSVVNINVRGRAQSSDLICRLSHLISPLALYIQKPHRPTTVSPKSTALIKARETKRRCNFQLRLQAQRGEVVIVANWRHVAKAELHGAHSTVLRVLRTELENQVCRFFISRVHPIATSVIQRERFREEENVKEYARAPTREAPV